MEGTRQIVRAMAIHCGRSRRAGDEREHSQRSNWTEEFNKQKIEPDGSLNDDALDG